MKKKSELLKQLEEWNPDEDTHIQKKGELIKFLGVDNDVDDLEFDFELTDDKKKVKRMTINISWKF
jgi:hypothetical protein